MQTPSHISTQYVVLLLLGYPVAFTGQMRHIRFSIYPGVCDQLDTPGTSPKKGTRSPPSLILKLFHLFDQWKRNRSTLSSILDLIFFLDKVWPGHPADDPQFGCLDMSHTSSQCSLLWWWISVEIEKSCKSKAFVFTPYVPCFGLESKTQVTPWTTIGCYFKWQKKQHDPAPSKDHQMTILEPVGATAKFSLNTLLLKLCHCLQSHSEPERWEWGWCWEPASEKWLTVTLKLKYLTLI